MPDRLERWRRLQWSSFAKAFCDLFPREHPEPSFLVSPLNAVFFFRSKVPSLNFRHLLCSPSLMGGLATWNLLDFPTPRAFTSSSVFRLAHCFLIPCPRPPALALSVLGTLLVEESLTVFELTQSTPSTSPPDKHPTIPRFFS